MAGSVLIQYNNAVAYVQKFIETRPVQYAGRALSAAGAVSGAAGAATLALETVKTAAQCAPSIVAHIPSVLLPVGKSLAFEVVKSSALSNPVTTFVLVTATVLTTVGTVKLAQFAIRGNVKSIKVE